MKAILVFLAIVGLTCGAPKHHHKFAPRSLSDDLADFIAVLPLDDIRAVVDAHLASDGAFAAVVEYLQGDDWRALVDEVGDKPAVQEFIQYLTDAGLPVEDIIAAIRELIAGAEPGAEPDDNGSLRPLLDEIEDLLPVPELIALLNEKLQESSDFQDLYVTISSEDARNLVEEVRQIEEVQRLAQRLRDLGVRVDETLSIIYEFLGWGGHAVQKSPRDLAGDWQDFIDILPLGALQAVIREHLEEDGALAAAVIYLQGQEWRNLVDEVAAKQAVQDLIDYLTDAGLPIRDNIDTIRDIINNAEPGAEPDEHGSLRPVLEEMEEQLAGDELLALLDDKLENSPDFKEFYKKVSSDEARSLVEEVRQIDEVQRLADRLRDLGVGVDDILGRLYRFLGWGEPKILKSTRDLAGDLQDFIDILPLEAIRAVIQEHLAEDAGMAAAIIYLQGPEWRNLVDEVGAKQPVQDFIQYLTEAGLPIRDLIEGIRERIANAKPGVEPDENGSLRPLLDEIEEQLPGDELLALLNDKLENSASFQELYNKISSDEARNLVEEIRQIDEVQRLAGRLRDFDVRLDEVLARIYGFLGWGEPKVLKSTRDLAGDLQDFIDILPLEAIRAVIQEHLAEDGALAAAIIYLQGQEWRNLVDEVGAKQPVQDFIQYLTEAGLPIRDLIEGIRERIDNAEPGVEPDENGSLRPLLDEIEEQLPGDELLALLNDKLENSPSFQELYNKISSDEARNLVEEIRQIDEVQRLAGRLRDFDVRLDEVLARIYGFLGWGELKVLKSTRDLAGDLQDFLDIIPLAAIRAVIQEHLAEDSGMAAAIIYLQGPEWRNLVDEVGAKQPVQDFIQYLTDAGLPIRDLIEGIRERIDNAEPGVEPDENGSLRPLLDEIEEQLPGDELLALLNDKLENSPSFQELYNKISSDEARNLVEEIRQIDEVQRLAARLRDFDVRLDEVLARIYGFLGWGEP